MGISRYTTPLLFALTSGSTGGMARRVWQSAAVLLLAAAVPSVTAVYTNVDVMAALIADTKHYESAFMESVSEMREYESKFARIVKSREAAQAAQAAKGAQHNHPVAAARYGRQLKQFPQETAVMGQAQHNPQVGVADPLAGGQPVQSGQAQFQSSQSFQSAQFPSANMAGGNMAGGNMAGGNMARQHYAELARQRNPDSDHIGQGNGAAVRQPAAADPLDAVVTDTAVVEALINRQKAYAAYLEQKALVAELVEAMEEATPAFTLAFGACAVTNEGGCIVSEHDADNPNGVTGQAHRRLHQLVGDSGTGTECPTKDFAALMVSRGIPLPAECDGDSHSRLNLMLEKHAGADPVSKGAQDTHCTIRVNKPVTLKVVRWELNTCRADALWERDGQKDQDTCDDLMTINGIPFFTDSSKSIVKGERSPHDLTVEKGELIRWLSTSSASSYWKLCEANTFYSENKYDDLPGLINGDIQG